MTKAPGIRDYAVEQVSNLLGKLVFQAHHAARSHHPDAIHDLRVAIRRFNQAMRAFGQFLPAREVKKIRRRLREIMNAAARVRDRDIALELCAEASLPETAPLRQTLAGQRDQRQRELRNRLKRFEARDYSSRWRVRLRL
ncbi:MAG: CHAD domain-containing protein [Acidobacteriota bacterium]|nr:CHAD domain-containing protein [Bryobacterales bacterium]